MNIFQKLFKPKEQKSFQSLEQMFTGKCANSVPDVVCPKIYIDNAMAGLVYQSVAPVALSVDTIAEEVKNIPPHLFNIETDKFLPQNHKLLKFLAQPNTDENYKEFMRDLSTHFLIYENAFVLVQATVTSKEFKKSEPSQMWAINPEYITIDEKNTINTPPDWYKYTTKKGSLEYKKEIVDGRIRYYNEELKQELRHIKGYSTTNRYWALSKISQIYYAAMQYVWTEIHNSGLLSNSANISLLVTMSRPLDDTIRERLRQQLRSKYTGATNAGKVLLFDNAGDAKFQNLSMNAKDMDFAKLKEMAEKAIYKRFEIPLPLVSEENSTYNNLAEARLDLYDRSVLPITAKLFEELSGLLFIRYKDLDKKPIILHYEEADISALEIRTYLKAKVLKETGSITHNEIRESLRFKAIPGGNTLYQEFSLVPLGTTTDIEPDAKKLEYFLATIKNKDGKPLFKNEDIKSTIKDNKQILEENKEGKDCGCCNK